MLLRAAIQRQLTESGAPSIALALARDGKIIWEEGFGWADRENRTPATHHTLYSLASISKPITATGLMVLAERGRVDLDKPANDYLGPAKIRARTGNAAAATLRRIANHSAGLPLHYQFFYEDEPYRRPSMDETILRYANLVTPPGEHYQYSNLGYGILDYVIARQSGRRYPDFMREEVFAPLGLTHMSVDIGSGLRRTPRSATPLMDRGSRSTISTIPAAAPCGPARTTWSVLACSTSRKSSTARNRSSARNRSTRCRSPPCARDPRRTMASDG